jgi:bacillithiol synthase
MITLPFDALPGTPRIFCDYVANHEDASAFFMGHFTDMLAWETHLQQLEQRQYPREALYNTLTAQNKRFRAGAAVWNNLESLKRENTYAVVTGQQVGLFTGPLYTVYKALTAVHLAAWLKEQFPGYGFVPVFWMECEDHDFLEINNTGLITAGNDFHRITYAQPAEDDEKNLAPVASITFDERIEATIRELTEQLPATEFSEQIAALLANTYQSGVAMHVAFARLFNELYPDAGIIFLDPTDVEIKRLAAPVVVQELETFPTTGEEVIKRSAELDELYHAQIKPRAVNLFMIHKGNRYAIEPGDQGFFLKGTRQRFSREDLLGLADSAPERFSPNVLLRPIVQDSILPTVSYIAGPSEVAYFAQLQPAYDHFQLPMPVITPRCSITIVERKIEKLFGKYLLPYAAMFMDSDEMFRIATSDKPDEAPELDFSTLSATIHDVLATLPAQARMEHANLGDPADATVRNIQRALATFEEKLSQHRRQKDEVMTRQLTKMQSYLVPEGKPQERQVNVLVLLNRYGRDILPMISDACLPFPAEHRLLML